MGKDNKRREELSWSPQEEGVDPHQALETHLRINTPGDQEHLFAHTNEKGKRVPLTRHIFAKRIEAACKASGVNFKQLHSFRIGGTLEYLLRGVPFAEVQSMGRWSSDAFLVYLRRHAEVLTPYMQPQTDLHGAFIRYALPPVL